MSEQRPIDTMARTYGMWCYNCKAEVEIPMPENNDQWRAHCELENKAKGLGWGMGLMASGQAYYSCSECANGLYNFTTFHGYPDSAGAQPEQR